MINFTPLRNKESQIIGFAILIDDAESMAAFKELVFRGTNLWVDAPAEIKTFADEVEHGKALQDYASQDTSPSGKRKRQILRGSTASERIANVERVLENDSPEANQIRNYGSTSKGEMK